MSDKYPADQQAAVACPDCRGTGDEGGNPSYGPCKRCDGKGKVQPGQSPSPSVEYRVTPVSEGRAALVSPPDNGEPVERVTEVMVEPFTDRIVLLMTGEGETLSAILDTSCATELRDKLAAALQSHNEGSAGK